MLLCLGFHDFLTELGIYQGRNFDSYQCHSTEPAMQQPLTEYNMALQYAHDPAVCISCEGGAYWYKVFLSVPLLEGE